MGKPDGWPDRLAVWDHGTSWDGLAVDPDDDPETYIQEFLDDIADNDTDAAEMWASEHWANAWWDDERGCYFQEGLERSNGAPVRYERSYTPDGVHFYGNVDD